MHTYSSMRTRKPLTRSVQSMKRVGFRKRIHVDAAQNSQLNRLRKACLRQGGSLKAHGKKAKLRELFNRQLRARFRAMSLYDVCEARLTGCWNTDLTWAHGRKDRELTMHEREFLVIRACTPCHRKMDEDMGHEGMLVFVLGVIERRRAA